MQKLENYIQEHSKALSEFATIATRPLHIATRDPSLDFSDLLRQPVSGQKHAITAGVKKLNLGKSLLYVCATGTGKTLISIATIHKHSQSRNHRVLVFCPGQLVKKWKREIENTVPNASVTIIRSWTELLKFKKKQKRSGFEWFVIGRDRAKLGCGWDTATWVRSGTHYCPDCGLIVLPGKQKCDQAFKGTIAREGCGAKLVTSTRQFNRISPAWYIKRYLKGYFDYLVLDEIHEERSIDSQQGIASGQLAAACGKVICLTGTLVGGLAEHLRPILFRVSPSSLVRAGFTWSGKAKFNEEFGRYEVTKTDSGQYKKLMPGIMPSLFGSHLMGKTIFLSLEEVADDLPSKQEFEIACPMEPEVQTVYHECEEEITGAMSKLIRNGGMGGLGAALSFLMSYPDYPFNWKPITTLDANGFEEVICTPTNFDFDKVLPKEMELIRIVREQHERGRKCWVYVQGTKEHDVQTRLKSVLTTAGFKVAVLKSSVKPELREEWIAKHGPDADVIISHPTLVQTGLDFFDPENRSYNLPTLIFYQLGYNPFQTRQAAGRAWRIGQWHNCEVYYLHAVGSMQSRNLEMMAKKIAASLSLEGEFSSEGLLAMLGDGQESAEVMLAKSLVNNTPIELSRVWEKINSKKFGGRDFFETW
jgi:SNF2 family DNA or RNA helicase